jgi:hypothetical protein
MRISRWIVGLLAVTAIAVPVALADQPSPTPPTAANAYGVICQRPPYNNKPGTEAFRTCVTTFAKATKGTVSPSDAARKTCRNATPPLPGVKFGECVSSTQKLMQGLQALRAQ